MKPEVLSYLMRLVAAGIQIQQSGLTATLQQQLAALIEEGKHSILEPQANGLPWDDAAILALAAEHDAHIAHIRQRHEAQG